MGPSSISQQRDATSATESQHWDEQRAGRWRILGLQKEPHGCQEPPSPPATRGADGAVGKARMQGTRSGGWVVSVSSTTNIPAVSTNPWRRNTLNLAAWLQQRNMKPRDFHHSFSTKPLCSPTYAPLRHPPPRPRQCCWFKQCFAAPSPGPATLSQLHRNHSSSQTQQLTGT